MTGASMGGHITAVAIEHFRHDFVGAMPYCGVLGDVRLFDRANLKSPNTRFVLAGIVNRMDRAYVSEESCGEIRFPAAECA